MDGVPEGGEIFNIPVVAGKQKKMIGLIRKAGDFGQKPFEGFEYLKNQVAIMRVSGAIR